MRRILIPLAVGVTAAIAVMGAFVVFIRLVFPDLDPDFDAVLAATGPVLAVVFTFLVGRQREAERLLEQRAREVEQTRREQQIAVFQSFIKGFLDILYSERLTGEPLNQKEMLEFFLRFTRDAVTWVPDHILNGWSQLRMDMIRMSAGGTASSEDSMEMMFRFEDLMIDMRRELGFPETSLEQGDILRLFINDIDDYLPSATGTP